MMKFAKEFFEFFEVFLIVGLTSGFLLGILAYLFLVRVLNKREAIEASLERLRLNVLSHRIPLIEFTMPIIFVIDRFIYGFNFKHRLFGSAFIGFLITSASLIYLYNNYLTIDGSTRIEKLRLERATDPWLFDIATKQQYKIILEKAYSTHTVYVPDLQGNFGEIIEYSNNDSASKAIRERFESYEETLVKKLSVHNLKSDISILLLFDGHSIKPGFKGKACFGLFLFNFLLDLIAALALQKVLSISQPNPNFQRASLMVLILLIACFVLFTGAFFSYSNFFSSNVEIFAAYTIDFSILIVMFGFGIIAITLSVLSFIDDPIVGLGSASIGLLLIFIAVKYFAAAIEKILIASHHIWQSVGRTNMIFVLSSTTIIPILTILIVLLITISIKCLSEGIREALAAHVNFVRIETGGSNIAALVVFLSFLIALFSAIIFK